MKRRIDVTGVGRMRWLELTAETPAEERRLATFYITLRRTGKATLQSKDLMMPTRKTPK